MDKKTFELTFVVRYEVTEEMLSNYMDDDGNIPRSFEGGLALDVEVGEEMTQAFWDAVMDDGDEFTVTGRILEDS